MGFFDNLGTKVIKLLNVQKNVFKFVSKEVYQEAERNNNVQIPKKALGKVENKLANKEENKQKPPSEREQLNNVLNYLYKTALDIDKDSSKEIDKGKYKELSEFLGSIINYNDQNREFVNSNLTFLNVIRFLDFINDKSDYNKNGHKEFVSKEGFNNLINYCAKFLYDTYEKSNRSLKNNVDSNEFNAQINKFHRCLGNIVEFLNIHVNETSKFDFNDKFEEVNNLNILIMNRGREYHTEKSSKNNVAERLAEDERYNELIQERFRKYNDLVQNIYDRLEDLGNDKNPSNMKKLKAAINVVINGFLVLMTGGYIEAFNKALKTSINVYKFVPENALSKKEALEKINEKRLNANSYESKLNQHKNKIKDILDGRSKNSSDITRS